MKRFLTVYFTIISCVLFSQTPNRTVNITSNIVDAANRYSTITAALAGAPANTTIWVAAGTYTEAELIIPAGVTVIGGSPPQRNHLRTAHLSWGGHKDSVINSKWTIQASFGNRLRHFRWI